VPGQLTPWKTVLIQGLACYNKPAVTVPHDLLAGQLNISGHMYEQ